MEYREGTEGTEEGEDSVSRYQFEFKGNAKEYFGIWIVNLLLTIVTLGVYSAWAKVRTNRYFYGNTVVAGSGFDYTADPMKILIGRIIAVILLVAYQASVRFYPSIAAFTLPVFFVFVPAIYVVSMAFRMRYSSWRGINFSFQRDFRSAYKLFSPVFIYVLIVTVIPYFVGLSPEDIATGAEDPELEAEMLIYFGATFSVLFFFMGLFPLWQKKYYEFLGNRVSYGCSDMDLQLSTKTFYGIYSKSLAMVLLGFVPLFFLLGFAIAFLLGEENLDSIYFLFAVYPVILLPYLFAFAYVQTRLTNTLYSNIALEDITFESSLAFWPMLRLYFTNTLAIIFTIGLAIPWAKIRLARYRADKMVMIAPSLDIFVGRASQEIDAKAEALSDVFDFDIGL